MKTTITRLSLVLSCAVISTVLLLPDVVQAKEQRRSSSGAAIHARGGRLNFDNGIEWYIVKGASAQRIAVTINEVGVLKEHKHLPALKKGYSPMSVVYSYTIEGSSGKDFTVEFPAVPNNAKQANRRWDVQYYQDGKWHLAHTIVNTDAQRVRARIPASVRSGYLVVTYHQTKRERPRQKFGHAGFSIPLNSQSATVQDMATGQFLYRRYPNTQRSIASITKLMTVYTALRVNDDMDRSVEYDSDFSRIGATVHMRDGEVISAKQALMGALVPSANNMAMTVARNSGLSEKKFPVRMNSNAKRLKLTKTRFVEPTGLNSRNVSSADNVSKLMRAIFVEHPELMQEAANTRVYHFITRNTNRDVNLYTTNQFNGRGKYALKAFKTGYLPGTADRTLVAIIEEIATGRQVIVTLLKNPNYGSIFSEAYALAEWSFSQWEFPTHASFQ